MEPNEHEKIKDRIRKLLAVARNSGATEGEVYNALMAANALMRKHRICESDLTVMDNYIEAKRKVDLGHKDIVRTSVGASIYAWEAGLSVFVCDYVGGIGAFLDNNKFLARNRLGIVVEHPVDGGPYNGKSVCFYGLAEDAMLGAEVYEEIRTYLSRRARELYGGCYKGEGGVYCQGFVTGLFERVEQAKALEHREANGTGLIVIQRQDELTKYKERAASSYLEECGVSVRSRQGSEGATGTKQAFDRGRRDGAEKGIGTTRKGKLE